MRKNILFLCAVATLAFSACAQTKKTSRTGKLTKTAASIAKYSMLTMTRTPCYGKCPVFDISITSDGMLTYEGKRFTETLGTYTKQATDKKQVATLFQSLVKYQVDTCSEKYEKQISDLPSTNFIFVVNGKEQKVTNAIFGPKFFHDIVEQVNELAKVDDTWKKIADPLPQE